MNECLSCAKRGRSIDDYYEEFVKLSRHAPLMIEEQKLSRFIIALEGHLAEEMNALQPASLADALIRGKAKLLNLQSKDQKRSNPYQHLESFQPQKANPSYHPIHNPEISNATPFVQTTQINALPINQSGRQIQCFERGGWGHKKPRYPNKTAQKRTLHRPPLLAQREAFLNRNKNQSIGQASTQPTNVKVNYVSLEDEQDEQAKYFIIEEPWNYEEGITEGIEVDLEEKE